MKTNLISIYFFASCAVLSGQVVVKGHYIGESMTSFRASEHIDQQLATCRISDAKTVSAYHISQMSQDEFQAFQHTLPYEYRRISRKKAETLAAGGTFNTPDSRSYQEQANCNSLLAEFDRGTPSHFTRDAPVPVSFSFEDERVCEITFRVPGAVLFDEMAADLTQRIGEPPEVRTVEMYNSSGAKWKERIAIWLDSAIHAVVAESNNPVNQGVLLTVESRTRFDAELKRRANAPSPLD